MSTHLLKSHITMKSKYWAVFLNYTRPSVIYSCEIPYMRAFCICSCTILHVLSRANLKIRLTIWQWVFLLPLSKIVQILRPFQVTQLLYSYLLLTNYKTLFFVPPSQIYFQNFFYYHCVCFFVNFRYDVLNLYIVFITQVCLHEAAFDKLCSPSSRPSGTIQWTTGPRCARRTVYVNRR